MGSNLTSTDRSTLVQRVLAGYEATPGNFVPRLGGVDRSTVAVIGASTLAGSARPTIAYFGATDGMLHAVCASVRAARGCDVLGRELWAYIPRTRSPTCATTRRAIDGSPRVHRRVRRLRRRRPPRVAHRPDVPDRHRRRRWPTATTASARASTRSTSPTRRTRACCGSTRCERRRSAARYELGAGLRSPPAACWSAPASNERDVRRRPTTAAPAVRQRGHRDRDRDRRRCGRPATPTRRRARAVTLVGAVDRRSRAARSASTRAASGNADRLVYRRPLRRPVASSTPRPARTATARTRCSGSRPTTTRSACLPAIYSNGGAQLAVFVTGGYADPQATSWAARRGAVRVRVARRACRERAADRALASTLRVPFAVDARHPREGVRPGARRRQRAVPDDRHRRRQLADLRQRGEQRPGLPAEPRGRRRHRELGRDRRRRRLGRQLGDRLYTGSADESQRLAQAAASSTGASVDPIAAAKVSRKLWLRSM